MAAGLRNRRTAGIHARTGNGAAVYCLLDAEHVASHFAHSSEAAQQGAMRFGNSVGIDESEVAKAHFGHIVSGTKHVPMGIDETGHQHAAVAFDHGRALRWSDRLLIDRGDGLTDDQYVHRVREPITRPIKDAHIRN